MRITGQLNAKPGVTAALVMGTQANKSLLREASMLTEAGEAVGPNDLLIAIRAVPDEVRALLAEAERELSSPGIEDSIGRVETSSPRTLLQAAAALPRANLALISTPGAYAAAEALKALSRGLHVFMFSDNVSPDAELMIKREAARRGLLMMGPDCGTAIIDGAPLGFANVVRRGDIGLIGASGTGLQEVSCLIDRAGCGISQVIGVGSHDMTAEIGSSTTLLALDLLSADPLTRVIGLISKPPAASEARRILARAAGCGKPVVAAFLGCNVEVDTPAVVTVSTLEEAANQAVALSCGGVPQAALQLDPDPIVRQLAPGRRQIRALFTGGTFAEEAKLILGAVSETVAAPGFGEVPVLPAGDLVLDVGADQFTVGRPHPMMDPTLRTGLVSAAARAADTAVVLFDVVIGYGAAEEPTASLIAIIDAARRAADRGPAFIAFVCGTEADPQGLTRQESALVEAGVIVAPSSTAAARLARAVSIRVADRVE
jgi:FdrA protein